MSLTSFARHRGADRLAPLLCRPRAALPRRRGRRRYVNHRRGVLIRGALCRVRRLLAAALAQPSGRRARAVCHGARGGGRAAARCA
eukprot:3140424-Prymnesium_polylepis.1